LIKVRCPNCDYEYTISEDEFNKRFRHDKCNDIYSVFDVCDKCNCYYHVEKIKSEYVSILRCDRCAKQIEEDTICKECVSELGW
jgi:phage terminase large subunit GpA-like protein